AVNYARFANRNIIDQIAEGATYQLPQTDKMQQLDMVKTFAGAVTPQHIRAAALQMTDSVVKLAVVGPNDAASKKTTEATLRKAWLDGQKSEKTAFTLEERKVTISTVAPKDKGIVAEEKLPALSPKGQTRRYRLANGMQVIVHSDPTLTGKITMNMRAAGGTTSVDNGIVAVPSALSLPMKCGIGDLRSGDIVKAARSAQVSLVSYAEQLHHGFRGEADFESVPMLGALLEKRLNQPVFCDSALAQSRSQSINDLQHVPVERRFMDAISKEAFTHGEELLVTEEKIRKMGSAQDLKALEAKLVGDPERLVVSIAGNRSCQELIEAFAPWLNAVKKRSDNGVRPSSKVQTKTFAWATAPKTMVQMHYRAPAQWTHEAAANMSIIGPAVNLMLREKLRTELSGVYVVSMNQLLSREPGQYWLGRLNFTAAPERAQTVQAAARKAIADLGREGLSIAAFRQAKTSARLTLERQTADSWYWSEALAQSLGKDSDIRALAQAKETLEAVSLDSVNKMLKNFLSTTPSVYVLSPRQGQPQ
ncbi:MAG: insulinase family protein, partial [Sutterellaceae bacterium]|nr:insulinase family protein [Sutterellaceae bacterium]